MKQLTPQKIAQYKQDGYAVFQEIYDEDSINEVKNRMREIVETIDVNKERDIAVFSADDATQQQRDEYFLNSAWQIKPFYEKDALDNDGNLIVPKQEAFNKVGHNMHDLDPVFEKLSYSKVSRTLLFKLMEFKQPLIVQSMYIFKNSRIGGEVDAHKDNSFLLTTPLTCQGIWLGLDSASKDNGCLWGVPGSHREKPFNYLRQVINEKTGGKTTHMVPKVPEKQYSIEGAVPLETSAGAIVVLHGNFLHFSHKNTSNIQRHAYTLHIVEGSPEIKYDDDNWIQRPADMPFKRVENDL